MSLIMNPKTNRPELSTCSFKRVFNRQLVTNSMSYDITYMSDDSVRKLIAENVIEHQVILLKPEAIEAYGRFKALLPNKVRVRKLDGTTLMLQVVHPELKKEGTFNLHDIVQEAILTQYK